MTEIQYISVRITLKNKPEETHKQMTTFLTKVKATKYLFSLEETVDNPHLQGSFQFNEISKIQRIRNIFKKCFPHLVGNANYSIKTTYKSPTGASIKCDKKLLYYCCKGVSALYEDSINPIIKYSNYSKDEIFSYHKEYYYINKTIKEIKKAKKQNSRATSSDFYNKAYLTLYPQSQLPTEHNPKPGQVHTSQDGIYRNDKDWIKTRLVEYHRDKKLLFSRNRFQNTFCYIIARANPDLYQQWMEEQVEFI